MHKLYIILARNPEKPLVAVVVSIFSLLHKKNNILLNSFIIKSLKKTVNVTFNETFFVF